MSPLLTIQQLSVAFRGPRLYTEVVTGINMTLHAGEKLALVGESGSGKSVTALALLRLHEAEQVRYSGMIQFEGQDLLTCSPESLRRTRGRDIAMIFQEPMTSLNPVYSIGEQLIEPLVLHHGLSRTQARKQMIELLDRTGIDQPDKRFDHFPHTLSGGQRQRVMIAMALACRPKLLIADEPTTALDVTIQLQIIELLEEMQREFGMSILLITHDLNIVRRFAERVCVMQHGQQQGWRKVGYVPAVEHESIQLFSGETLGLVGESGSGKTTLGMCLLRLQACQGQIMFDGQRLDTLKNRQLRPLRRHFQVVFQDPYASLSPRMTVEQIIGEGLRIYEKTQTKAQHRQRIINILEEVGLESSMLARYPHEFSGGQRQRIAIARVVILEPKLILLDEPTSALDVSVQKQVLALLRDLQQRHRISYLFITHDLAVIRAMAHRVIVMRQGKLIEQGPTEKIFNTPQQAYTKILLHASLFADRPFLSKNIEENAK